MVNQVLKTLADTLTVQSLMTPFEILERADSFDEAQPLHVKYDIVPYPKKGSISGFFKRGTKELHEITAYLLLNNGTRILEIPGLLRKSRFYFITSGNSIVGYLHYSDLNNTIAKVPFYILLQTVERVMWENTQSHIFEADLSKIFKASDVNRFIKEKAQNQKKNVNIGWVGVFSFPNIFKLAKFYGYTQLTDDQIGLLQEIRNRVSHSDRNLVSQYDDIQMLIDTYRLAEVLIKSA